MEHKHWYPLVENNRWYPLYHVAAPIGWINDPNGFCTYKGQYHLFYQYHPYSAQWGPMHWGHVVSKDLVHWKHLPIALTPVEDYEKEGCFSGSAIEKDGKLYLMYTGNTHEGQKQCLAISEDGIKFEKFEGNPIIDSPQIDEVNAVDFRDPKVWQHDGKYYSVIGSKTPGGEFGQVLLYESDDLINWTFKSIVARAKANEGNMWECPNFCEVDGQDVLIVSPMGINPVGKKFWNSVNSGYMIGKLNYEDGVYTHRDFKMIDYGSDFYAPQVTQLDDGRCIMVGWMAMWFADMPEQKDGWAGLMTVPRELSIKNGRVFTVPIKELKSLRYGGVTHKDIKISEPAKLDGIKGITGELLIDVDLKQSGNFAIEVRVGKEEETSLTYDKATAIFAVDRENSGAGPKEKREVELMPSDVLKIRIYLDRSSLEIFLNDGEAAMSERIYPAETSDDIVFVPLEGELTLKKVTFYKLNQGIVK